MIDFIGTSLQISSKLMIPIYIAVANLYSVPGTASFGVLV
jgi:hypothetical protein